MHSVHAKDSLIGERLSQVVHTSCRLEGECIDCLEQGGDAVRSAGPCEEEAVVGGDGGVCWVNVRGVNVRGNEKHVEMEGRRTGVSLLSWMWW